MQRSLSQRTDLGVQLKGWRTCLDLECGSSGSPRMERRSTDKSRIERD